MVPVIRNPEKSNEDADAVFYFPGCGSERLFSQVGLATQAMLYETGAITVLPPGYLCCGYPQTAAGQEDRGQKIITDNRVLFHRVANTLNYLDIKTVIVSCGTCMDQLQQYEFDKIFPGCRLLDIHEYLIEKGVRLEGVSGVRYMYHDPCHTPMKTYQPARVVNELMGTQVDLNDRCCGESGTRTYRHRCVFANRKKCKRVWMRSAPASTTAKSRFSLPARPACRVCHATVTTPALKRTTSWLKWQGICLARTGWRSMWRRPIAAASRGFCCEAETIRWPVMNAAANGCVLCEESGGEILWSDALARVVNVSDEDHPGFCRVVLQRHAREMTDLEEVERARVMSIVFAVEGAQRKLLNPDKINIACFGNMVAHVHWHVIPRFRFVWTTEVIVAGLSCLSGGARSR